ncbi:hypothetical protein H310_07683 [Aphanomyces invadans]|uniref:PH domain-containing protein n=1 Tax=Aphanomyces invadans TaxID=157072 RepID=A0A024U266_9STRA|nr:hypothetical protein H310_07683 [Aphanomyces invadans]ETW00310.1 hypothetical protein H310_07683 [Aphanomyces invadans]|eukprot:XP_008871335.1 hypothetical protein H310_07683 [Aphanomyces invadans]
MALTRRTSSFLSMRSGTATNILTEVKIKTKKALHEAEKVYCEFDINVADLLAQLALYCMMGGEYDEALPLLHRKLVIHEKFGPDECVGDTLQQLGTAYRLYANHALAVQHLEKALDRREKAAVATRSRKDHEKVAETLNSLALVHHIQGNAAVADAYHSRSVETYAMWAGADDGQSEDIPWEVFKRVQSEKSTPTMAQNSMTLLKTNLRMAIQDVAVHCSVKPSSSHPAEKRVFGSMHAGSHMNTREHDGKALNAPLVTAPTRMRSLSVGSAPLSDNRLDQILHDSPNRRNLSHAVGSTPPSHRHQHHISADHVPAVAGASHPPFVRVDPAPADRSTVHEPITTFPILVHRIEGVKHLVAAGHVVDADVNRLACDIALIAAGDLRQVGLCMLGLLHDSLKLSRQLDCRQLPVVEGYLEKKSSSLFRGWEKRWFKVDTRTAVMTYFHSKEDHMRGFAPRGTFALARISHIVTHQHLRGSHYAFDIVVDMGTRANPHACRTFELRSDSATDLKNWVDTIEKYKTATAAPKAPGASP